MKQIIKGNEPTELAGWKITNPHGRYPATSPLEKRAIREACASEQYYLCAYCCSRISGAASDTLNEHVEPQSRAPDRTVDFTNIVGSCKTKGQCDSSHKAQHLPLTPLMAECETELKFFISGRVEGKTPRAQDSVKVLNLGESARSNKALVERRKQMCQTLMLTYGEHINDGVEDDGLITLLISDLETPADGKLEPYAPALINILRQWLNQGE